MLADTMEMQRQIRELQRAVTAGLQSGKRKNCGLQGCTNGVVRGNEYCSPGHRAEHEASMRGGGVQWDATSKEQTTSD